MSPAMYTVLRELLRGIHLSLMSVMNNCAQPSKSFLVDRSNDFNDYQNTHTQLYNNLCSTSTTTSICIYIKTMTRFSKNRKKNRKYQIFQPSSVKLHPPSYIPGGIEKTMSAYTVASHRTKSIKRGTRIYPGCVNAFIAQNITDAEWIVIYIENL